MGKRRKQRKAAVDRDVISRLPDEILCNILSFLPTRTSVATSVLSHRWRYLWKKVHVLDLNDDFLYTPERSHEEAQERFLIFLNKFELLRRLIRKFHLSCRVGDYGYDDLFHWIDYVIGRVSELHFSMRTDGESHDLHEAFYSTSLVSLVLDGNIIIFLEDFDPIHSESIFPSLKNLELHVNYVDLNVLLSGCPALETLREQYSHSEDVTFELLEVNTPSLEYLRLSFRGCYKQILVCDYPKINKARLDIFPKPRHVAWVLKLLGHFAKQSSCGCKIQQSSFKSRLLIDLLHNCPKLQALKIYISEFIDADDVDSCGSYLNSHKCNGWTQPLSCIVSHLNTVEYRGYLNTPEEHEFTTYILQRGLVLKTMRIHAKHNLRLECGIYKALSEIQRVSSMCRLEVH
ncbi:hypothetical protein Ahy_A09g046436 [Arachis hypogaea]|uniref:F-box domain-containing protein n=1 Tax=Arachis hypogaea TaxID=3818 RepID=A0A445BPU2_ARAHY|nr:hypothetical protein Ahy_A09g046436 [Arachis hypogaea]